MKAAGVGEAEDTGRTGQSRTSQTTDVSPADQCSGAGQGAGPGLFPHLHPESVGGTEVPAASTTGKRLTALGHA